jgi:nicotinate-nucleotide adenylyltransferase
MVERAIDGNSRFELERAEIDRGGVSYTYDTMVTLKQQHPDTDFYFIIGADMVKDLPNWHRIDDLLKLVQFVGVKRPEFPAESRYPCFVGRRPLTRYQLIVDSAADQPELLRALSGAGRCFRLY